MKKKKKKKKRKLKKTEIRRMGVESLKSVRDSFRASGFGLFVSILSEMIAEEEAKLRGGGDGSS